MKFNDTVVYLRDVYITILLLGLWNQRSKKNERFKLTIIFVFFSLF